MIFFSNAGSFIRERRNKGQPTSHAVPVRPTTRYISATCTWERNLVKGRLTSESKSYFVVWHWIACEELREGHAAHGDSDAYDGGDHEAEDDGGDLGYELVAAGGD